MKVEKVSSNRVKFTFDVTPHEFEHGLDHAFDHAVKDVELKGFRKGKVPRNIFEQKFGVESLYEDALNHVLHHKYHDMQNHPDYEIVGQPQVEVDLPSIKRGETFSISLVAPIKPEVTLGAYKGVEVKYHLNPVTDEDVEAEIKRLLSQSGELILKEGKIEKGDTAIFDFEGFLNGTPFEGGKAENYQLEIGSNSFIPGFEDQMIGMAAGDEKDLNVTFPEAYQAKNLAGQPVVFKVKLHEVKQKTKQELNDVFVESLKKENVFTVEELKASIKNEIQTQREQEANNQFGLDVIDLVINNTSVDVPQEMVDEEMKHYRENAEQQAKQYGLEFDMFLSLSGVTKEQFEEQIKVEAAKRVLTTLIVEQVAKLENMTATEEELNEKYEDLAKRYNMPTDDVKKYLPKNVLSNDIAIGKAYQWIIDSAVKV